MNVRQPQAGNPHRQTRMSCLRNGTRARALCSKTTKRYFQYPISMNPINSTSSYNNSTRHNDHQATVGILISVPPPGSPTPQTLQRPRMRSQSLWALCLLLCGYTVGSYQPGCSPGRITCDVCEAKSHPANVRTMCACVCLFYYMCMHEGAGARNPVIDASLHEAIVAVAPRPSLLLGPRA